MYKNKKEVMMDWNEPDSGGIAAVLEGLSRKMKNLTRQIEVKEREVEPYYEKHQTEEVFYEIYSREETIEDLYNQRSVLWREYKKVLKLKK